MVRPEGHGAFKMACEMSDYDWEMFENDCNQPSPMVDPEIEEARRIISGNAGWYTQAIWAWAMEKIK
jgi:hypothetical protein